MDDLTKELGKWAVDHAIGLAYTGGVTTILVPLLVLLFLFPNQAKEWGGIVLGWLSVIWKKLDYRAFQYEIEGAVNGFIAKLEARSTAQFPRIKIKYEAMDSEQVMWEENEAIIIMRDRKFRNRNIVYATYFFTSQALLKKAKIYLSDAQKEALDLFATLTILQNQNKYVLEQFMDDYFSPSVHAKENVKELTKQFRKINKIGVFFPILMQELSYLGRKIFYEEDEGGRHPDQDIIIEVKSLIDFLVTFSERETGDTDTPDTFDGRFTRCSIKIIAGWWARDADAKTKQKEKISTAVRNGVENIYVIGRSDDGNKGFMESVVELAQNEFEQLKKIKSYQFPAEIKLQGGSRRKVKTYLIHLHNPEDVKYLYDPDDIGLE